VAAAAQAVDIRTRSFRARTSTPAALGRNDLQTDLWPTALKPTNRQRPLVGFGREANQAGNASALASLRHLPHDKEIFSGIAHSVSVMLSSLSN
jgi:hypothetical protein